jgi:hypothetical protein
LRWLTLAAAASVLAGSIWPPTFRRFIPRQRGGLVPATIQNDDPDDRVGWGIDNADSVLDGNNIQVTARIVVKGDGATVLRVAYHAVILG